MGPFPQRVLQSGRETGKYFTVSNIVYERDSDSGFQLILPKKTDLRTRLHFPPDNFVSSDRSNTANNAPITPEERLDNNLFVDFVQQMLNLDPAERLTAEEALQHPWLEDADRIHIGEYIIRQPGEYPPPPPPYDEEDEDDDDEEDDDEDDEDEKEVDNYGFLNSYIANNNTAVDSANISRKHGSNEIASSSKQGEVRQAERTDSGPNSPAVMGADKLTESD